MDIKSGCGYPASSLSNFAPHPFVIDGVQCASMEGFLQSLKFKNPEMQEYVCTLTGVTAKYKGKPKKWWEKQVLYWRGKEIDRHSQEYQDLLTRAYDALGENAKFKSALLATGNAVLRHSIGTKVPNRTILTEREFCSQLTRLRDKFQKTQ